MAVCQYIRQRKFRHTACARGLDDSDIGDIVGRHGVELDFKQIIRAPVMRFPQEPGTSAPPRQTWGEGWWVIMATSVLSRFFEQKQILFVRFFNITQPCVRPFHFSHNVFFVVYFTDFQDAAISS
jgi:hypothetical protein